jgi:outer membrane protein OmpA-like peptidoglycan-associated protein
MIGALLIIIFAGGPGSTIFPLLRIDMGPRAAALGGAFSALSGDVSLILFNPSGIADMKSSEISVGRQEWFAGFKDHYLLFAIKQPLGTIGIGGIFSSVGGIETWSDENERGEDISVSSWILTIGYAEEVLEELKLGASLKLLHEDLYLVKGDGVAFDLGFQVTPFSWFSLGGSLQNVGSGVKYGKNRYPLPRLFRFGGALSPFKSLILVADGVSPRGGDFEIHLGIEYTIQNLISLRIGWRNGPQEMELGGWTYGVGALIKRIYLDYAFVPYGKLGYTHRFGIKYVFPGIERLPAIIPGKSAVLLLKVIDKEKGDPLEAFLTLSGVIEGEFKTNPKTGELRKEKKASGWVKFRAVKQGYQPVIDSVLIKRGEETIKIVEMMPMKPGEIGGYVYDAATMRGIGATINFAGPVEGAVASDLSTGFYRISDLPPGFYTIEVEAEGYETTSCTLQIFSGQRILKDFHLNRPGRGRIIGKIRFDTGKAIVKREFYPVLDSIGILLKENPRMVIEVSGHTDPREIRTTEFPSNWVLAEKRASAVKKYLVEKFGISPSRIIIKAYADTQPVASNETEEGMAKNRRVEFRILSE